MRRATIRVFSLVAVSLLMVLTAGEACADLYSATAAYKKADYAGAFEQFKELAELGQPIAQLNLAVMYARGQGIMRNFTYAHAWASLAAANGEEQAKAIVADLAPQLTPTSLRISSEIQAQYAQAALAARLLPHFLKGKEYADRDPVRPWKTFMPVYPAYAEVRGVQGEVYVEFIVAPDGHARIPRILYALPTGTFDAAVRESVMRSLYLPARIDGQPVASPASMFYHFVVKSVTIGDYGDLARRVHSAEKQAEAGDASAEMLYGMMIAGLPQLKKTYDQALPWFLKAAQSGAPYAQYQIGTALMLGHGCQCDAGKGEIWLEKAAQADQPDAQVSLAEYLLRDKPSDEAIASAKLWLERAVKQGNNAAKLQLSALLAASPVEGIRDPRRALGLTDQLEHEYKHDPSLWEIRAAASASNGDFKGAREAQSRAIAEATRLGWDLAKLQQRESHYASGQTWSGDLLAF